jgi:hypothetical protein
MGMEMTGGSGMTPAEAILTTNQNNRSYDDGMFGGGFMWVFFLFFLLAWGGNGFGFGGNNAAQGALTRGELCQDMNFQQVENGVRGIQQGLCDGFYTQNTTLLNSFGNVQRDLCTGFATVSQGFNDVNANINQSRFDNQQCCCETNRNIDSVRYENAKNTCEIINANNANTQRIIDQMTQNEMQNLRDRLQTAQFQLSQQNQNAYLVNELRPCPVPAYLTASPYAAYPYGLAGLSGLNGLNGCSC